MALDIFKFINSRDIRTHLKEISYPFSAPEAAYLVYFSYRATLDEKLNAWQEIIDTMPDCSMEKRLNLPHIPSIHDFLRQCMQAVRADIHTFYQSEHCAYSYTWHVASPGYFNECWWLEGELFSTFAACMEDFERQGGSDGDTGCLRINRIKIRNGSRSANKRISMFWNEKKEMLLPPLDLDDVAGKSVTTQFHNMWFDFPTPFRFGDIVRIIGPHQQNQAAVLDYLSTWNCWELLQRGVPFQNPRMEYADKAVDRARKMSDESDMRAYGFGFDECGQFCYHNYGFASYLDIERIDEPLVGKNRFLYSVSNFLKGKFDLGVLLNLSDMIRVEEEYNRKKSTVQCYQADILKTAGFGTLAENEPNNQ